MTRLENRTFDELQVGERETVARTLTSEDVERVAQAAAALDPDAAAIGLSTTNGFQAIAISAGWAETLVAAAIATRFPGPGATIARHRFEVVRSAAPGDPLILTLIVKSKAAEGRCVTLECRATLRGESAMTGEVEVVAPAEKIIIGSVNGHPAEAHEKGAAIAASCKWRTATRLSGPQSSIPSTMHRSPPRSKPRAKGSLKPCSSAPRRKFAAPRRRTASTFRAAKFSRPNTATPPPTPPSRWRAPEKSKR